MRIVVCANQVTVAVAKALVKRDESARTTFVLYSPDRCDIADLLELNVMCIPFTRRLSCLFLILRCRLAGKVEICVPHYKFGRSLIWLSRLCSRVSLIDDGLDTFREVPRNVEPEKFEPGTTYYTFQYPSRLGRWLVRFQTEPVANIETLADIRRQAVDFERFDDVVIESPPIQRVLDRLPLSGKRSLFVAHSNVNKRVISSVDCESIMGANIALEKSLSTFTGRLIVGESMIAVFALMYSDPKYTLVVYLARENRDILLPLIEIIESKSFAELILC
ncbi:hypothetical protein [Rhizobium sp. 1399]|uniref:hypothetical protein n=1 Tax=Rhizobium sp. 1399 TaxID=2817758 RepID=UPI002857C493|nr:hypothetical protein [Rhizobium sp. 1399]MDR6671378.1 hypothetical protein [Rhizobium sp. 1399]